MSERSAVEILLVEDNPADVFLTEAAFEAAGVAVQLHLARDGVEALDLLTPPGGDGPGLSPRLVLLDLNMPRKNGFEVLNALKANDQTRHLPVVILTTSAAQSDVERCYQLQANAYVTKPSGLDEFIEFIRVLERYWLQVVRLPEPV
ncbi:response regulator [Deinococcus sonorensis]|uniref:Response regulator n=2 Tax=Deinococcus sonorensis TaxID=309891 RepID=A0AAU7UG95_9DEIO